FGQQHPREQGKERRAKGGDPGSGVFNIEHGVVGTLRDRTADNVQQQEQYQRKSQPKQEVDGIAQYLFCVAPGEQHRLHTAPPERATKASSRFSFPVCCVSSSTVPTAASLPQVMTPIRSDSTSTSSK